MRWLVLPGILFFCVGCDPQPDGVATWTISAELVEATDFPTLEEIRPYRDALIAHRYRVVEIKGEPNVELPVSSSGDMAVYHWAIIEDENTAAENLKIGDRVELVIQRMIDRPDLKNRYRKNGLDAFELQEFFALP